MWLDLAKSLLPERQQSDDQESKRDLWEASLEAFLPQPQRKHRGGVAVDAPLPHPSELPSYALRGYGGPPVVIANERYPKARRASSFMAAHAAHINANPGLVDHRYVERDVHNVLELLMQTPVRILPTVHPRP